MAHSSVTERTINLTGRAIELMMEHTLTVTKATERAGITLSSFYRVLQARPDLELQYVRALQVRAHRDFDRLEEYEGMLLDDEIDAAKFRALVESTRWRIGKMCGQYAEKTLVSVTGSVEHNHTVSIPAAVQERLQAIYNAPRPALAAGDGDVVDAECRELSSPATDDALDF